MIYSGSHPRERGPNYGLLRARPGYQKRTLGGSMLLPHILLPELLRGIVEHGIRAGCCREAERAARINKLRQ